MVLNYYNDPFLDELIYFDATFLIKTDLER